MRFNPKSSQSATQREIAWASACLRFRTCCYDNISRQILFCKLENPGLYQIINKQVKPTHLFTYKEQGLNLVCSSMISCAV